MRRLGITTVVMALSMAGTVAVAHATQPFGLRTPVHVTPARGVPTATFKIRFTTPLATGSFPDLRSWEIASVVDRGQSSRSCTSTAAMRLPNAVAHHRVGVTFAAGPAKRWCTGVYAGTITLYRSIVCGPPLAMGVTACPEIAFAPEPIGSFQFTVGHASS